MKEARAKEYADHFEHMESTLRTIPQWPADEVIRQGDLNSIHACVDESLNMSKMLLKDLGHELSDDEQNLMTLHEEFILTDAQMDRMKDAIAFRDQILSGTVDLNGVMFTEKIEHVKSILTELMDLFKEVLEDDLAD
jgi:uncharacterized protein YutE (UPF0331/DUF86 family)